MITKYLLATFAVLLVALTWLIFAWVGGRATESWSKTKCDVINLDTIGRVGRPRGWIADISYSYEGKTYSATVNEYLVGNDAVVYVNPDDPTQVVGSTGVQSHIIFKPMLLTIGSGLFLLVLLLIRFSPKDN